MARSPVSTGAAMRRAPLREVSSVPSDQDEGAIDRWFDPAMYALGTFTGAGLITIVIELPRFQTMETWKAGMFVVMGIVVWGAGVQGLYLEGNRDDG